MKREVILIFDVGKTNKKALLFDDNLNVISEAETRFEEVVDDDGFPCDDGDRLEAWIDFTLKTYLHHDAYKIRAVNFSTYGATLVFTDKQGKRITPIYNYLKPMPGEVLEGFYERYGGLEEFSRRTASPALGMINSGLQALWLKLKKPEIYKQVEQIFHLPQYLSGRFTGQIRSEHTSIGCHTGLWDFDGNKYHQWLREEEITLPEPDDISLTIPVEVYGHALLAGIGIHDSSASLAPYVVAAKRPFVLISTGTWCINMNPFNDEPLTAEELRQDCLCYLSVKQKPVKSSRFFLGHIHDVNVEALESYFQVEKGSYKQIRADRESIRNKWDNKKDALSFFRRGIPEDFKDREIDLTQFNSFEEAYSRLMVDLTKLTIRSIRLIIPVNDPTDHLYITGGFAKNPFFIGFMALAFPGKHVFTSEIDNATSLGAALVIADRVWKNASESLDLGLKEVEKGER